MADSGDPNAGYDPNSDYGRLFNPLGGAGKPAAWWDPGGWLLQDPGAQAEAARKQALYQQAGTASGFADTGQANVAALGGEAATQRDYLRQLASGQNSVSAMQLQQGLQQNVAAQRSLAAGASPQNAAMAARTAAIQSGRLGAGLAGQQAVAGLQERQSAQQALSNQILQQRQQDMQQALQSRQQAMQGYGAQESGQPEKSNIEKFGGGIGALAGAIFSDRRLKTDVHDGSKKADAMLSALRATAYRYKDGKQHGEGEHVGPMAQDLERAGSRAVFDTPAGKAVHGARLATENTAMLAALRDRVSKLEGRKGR